MFNVLSSINKNNYFSKCKTPPGTLKMDLEDDTTILTTLKSFNTFISRPEHPQRPSEQSACGSLQSHYKRSMEFLEAAEKVHSQHRCLQLDQEKKQMELSHKRARFELEKAASDSARDLEHEVNRNQELLGQIKKLEEREKEATKKFSEQMEANRAVRKNLEGLNKKLDERETKLTTANQTISSLKDEIRDLRQKIQNQDSTISAQTLENQELQEQLDLQRRKYQEATQLCQSLQAAQSSCSEHIIKIKELERRLALQEQDIAIVKSVKSEVARVPDLEKELKRLREDNAFLRENRENCSLLKEEVEGLRRKLERMEKNREELVNVELEKEKLAEKLQAWENIGQSTGLNIRKPEDLSREVIQIQQREIALKEQNYTLSSRVRSLVRSQSEIQAELTQQCSKTLEEQKKREAQDALIRRLQKRVLWLTKGTVNNEVVISEGCGQGTPTSMPFCDTSSLCISTGISLLKTLYAQRPLLSENILFKASQWRGTVDELFILRFHPKAEYPLLFVSTRTRLLPLHLGPGRGGSRLSRDAQTSLSPDTSSSSSRGSPRHSQASRET
ncbi:hypothetical protein ATANTOWER_000341 [Ataeniobius toweri]|uniref:Mitotic spindle assembly checkpoint protein MAD1 n=1 Tax=Ataeniobius toweri TaxID=208326 RepID=A0ABU7BVV3_9TELE|nr:hypothetical protein [Ataeniobius toweri]